MPNDNPYLADLTPISNAPVAVANPYLADLTPSASDRITPDMPIQQQLAVANASPQAGHLKEGGTYRPPGRKASVSRGTNRPGIIDPSLLSDQQRTQLADQGSTFVNGRQIFASQLRPFKTPTPQQTQATATAYEKAHPDPLITAAEDVKNAIAQAPSQAYTSVTGLSREDAPYAHAALDFVGGFAAFPAAITQAGLTTAQHPVGTVEHLGSTAVDVLQSANFFDPNISGPERFGRALNAAALLYGGVEGVRGYLKTPEGIAKFATLKDKLKVSDHGANVALDSLGRDIQHGQPVHPKENIHAVPIKETGGVGLREQDAVGEGLGGQNRSVEAAPESQPPAAPQHAQEPVAPTYYHGTRAEIDLPTNEKSGGLLNLAYDQPTAERYATNQSVGNKRLSDKDMYVTSWDGDVYEMKDGSWKLVGSQPQDGTLSENNIGPITSRLPKHGDTISPDLMERLTGPNGDYNASPKKFRVLSISADIKNPLDLTTPKGIDVMKSLDPKGDPMARRIVENAKNGEFSWHTTQHEARTRTWQNVINPQLEAMGYDGIRFQDDSHKTLSAFHDSQLRPAQEPVAVHPDVSANAPFLNAFGMKGKYETLRTGDVGVMPGIQHRSDINPATGEVRSSGSVSTFDQGTAPISVWKDSEGKYWVVNGHHRLGIANRAGSPTIAAHVYDSADGMTFEKARLQGALENIRDKTAQPLDVVQALREGGISTEKLNAMGLNPKAGIAKDALALNKLTDASLDMVRQHEVSQEVAAGIGDAGLPPDREVAAMRKARNLKTRQEGEMLAESARTAPLVKPKGEQGSMSFDDFGDELALEEQAKIGAAAAKRLASDKRLAGFVAKGRAHGGTVIDLSAQEHAQAVSELAQSTIKSDPSVNSILERESKNYAENRSNGQFDKSVDAVVESAVEAAKKRHQELFGRGTGVDAQDGVRGPTGGEPPTSLIDVPPTPEELSLTSENKPKPKAKPEAEPTLATDEHTLEGQGGLPGTVQKPEGETIKGPLDKRKGASPGASVAAEVEPTPKGSPEPKASPAERKANVDAVSAEVKAALETTKGGTRQELGETFNPAGASGLAGRAARVLREGMARMVRSSVIREKAFDAISKAMDKLPDEDRLDFIDRMETGNEQVTPELTEAARILREQLDKARDEIRDLGQGYLDHYIEDYFPHIWENSGKGGMPAFLERLVRRGRSLKGKGEFLNKRTVPTLQEGIQRGLVPVTTNPVELARLKLRSMDQFLLGHRAIASLKDLGLLKFHPADFSIPKGWGVINDKFATVFASDKVLVREAFDARLRSAMTETIKNLEISHHRSTDMKPSNWWGRGSKGAIGTRFGGPDSVIAHELGHALDFEFGLWEKLRSDERITVKDANAEIAKLRADYAAKRDAMTGKGSRLKRAALLDKFQRDAQAIRERSAPKAVQTSDRVRFDKELRALADLRSEGSDPSQSFQKYIRNKREKMAVVMEAYAHMPDRMKEVAPSVYSRYKAFLESDDRLKPLAEMNRSLVLGSSSTEQEIGGKPIAGKWIAPEPVVRVVNNFLSPGLRGKNWYKAIQGANNALLQARLGLSAFHAGFVANDANISKSALGIQKLAEGDVAGGMGDIAKSSLQIAAPIESFVKGNRLMREYLSGSEGNEILNALISGGMRAKTDPFYHQYAAETFSRLWNDHKYARALFKAPGAALHLASKPIMEGLVPRIKLGVAADMAQFELKRLGPDATRDQVREAMARVVDSVDNRLGQMTYDNLFWDRTTKDIVMQTMQSAGWNIGTGREIGGGILDVARNKARIASGGPKVSPRTAYTMGLVAQTMLAGAIYTYLHTGKGPQSLRDYAQPQTGDEDAHGNPVRASLPSYAKDVYALSTHPLETLKNKESPLLSISQELLANEDYYRDPIRKTDNPSYMQALDVAEYIAGSFAPFAYRKWSDQTPERRAEQFVGITRAPKDTSDETQGEQYYRQGLGDLSKAKELGYSRSGSRQPSRPPVRKPKSPRP